MSRLMLYQDDQRVGEHILMRAVVSLGRHPDNDIVLNDLSLSRFHARIERRGDRYVVVDLGSQNGVFLNGVRISGEAPIRPGDRVGMGRYVGVFNEGAERRVRSSESETEKATPGLAADSPSLVLTHHGVEVDRFPLKAEGVVIGRSQRCDIVIGLLALSRRHARVRQASDAGWYVEDLGSQNGTYLNDHPVAAPTKLSSGDVLNFFEYSLVFSGDGAAVGLAPPAAPGGRLATAEDKPRLKKPKPKTRRPKERSAGVAPPRKPVGPVDTFEDHHVVSEVIELSVDDVEELSPEYDGVLQTRADRNYSAAESTAEDNPPPAGAKVHRSWPSSADTAVALAASQRPAAVGRIEVLVDGKTVTEVPLALGAVRIGSDARCDVALPPLPGIAPWHLLVTAVGEAVLMLRIGDAPAPRIENRAVYQAFLVPGEKVDLGRASIVYRA
ncbi:MAG: FHA domain-containing protein [Pseudomonadota bacterium]